MAGLAANDSLPLPRVNPARERALRSCRLSPILAEGWPPNYLPILELDGKEYLALDCAGLDGGAIRHNMNEDPTLDAYYRGLGHFLRVTLTAYESGAYRKRRGYLQDDPIGTALAFRHHAEPSELAALEGNWQRINTVLEKAARMELHLAITWVQLFPDER